MLSWRGEYMLKNEDKNTLNERSRLGQRTKRRKTNLILNSLIAIVLLLIVIVSFSIFFGNDKEATSSEVSNSQVTDKKEASNPAAEGAKKTSGVKEDEEDQDDSNDSIDEEETKDNQKSQRDENEVDENEQDIEDQQIITEGGNDPEVSKTIVNPAWEPVPTSQTGEHTAVYSGVDWDEMVQAISYGTGIEESNMTILFLGNNGVNKSVGTIQTKDTKQKYRVYIDWVDGRGWKPSLVEELAQ
jgi:cytoskeletal protein RodZ